MILFRTETFEIDLSSYGVSLREENDLFTDSTNLNYSLPGTIDADDELLAKLGFPTIENITNVNTAISGLLILPDTYYKAVLYLGEIRGKTLEYDISYGADVLPVYDRKLNTLPWPLIINTNLAGYANQIKSKNWPQTAFNFPMIYRPSIREESNYQAFEGFVNNHAGTGQSYLTNTVDNSGAEPEFYNRNVLAPCPYLLEILRFGYSLENKELVGDLVEHADFKKAVYLPEKYMERFRGSEYQNFSFKTPTRTLTENSIVYGIYETLLTPASANTYEISYALELDPVLARYFDFTIVQRQALNQEERILLQNTSQNNRVSIEDRFSINIAQDQIGDQILVRLKLQYYTESIEQYNSFEYKSNGGQLNEFPSAFSLADFVPDMTFGEFENTLKNWLNLDKTIQDKYVRLDFAQNSVFKKVRVDHSHLEIPEPVVKMNSNRFYTLRYGNGDEVYINKNGQVFSNQVENGMDPVEIEMDVWPAVVESNQNIVTGVYTEDAEGLIFAFYTGVDTNGKPTCSSELSQKFSLQNVLNEFWEVWINYRINSKSFKDTFTCSINELIRIDEISFKYNELHILKKINKKYLSERLMQVEIESETY